MLFDESREIFTSLDPPSPHFSPTSSDWHQILIYHDDAFSKSEILEGFFEIVDDEIFIPIGYKRGDSIDYFFLCQQSKALRKIFARNFVIPVKDQTLQIMVKMDVAKCQRDHKFMGKISEVIANRIENFSSLGVKQTLNLDSVASDQELREMTVNLGS